MKNSRLRLYMALLLLSAIPAPLMSQASFQGLGFQVSSFNNYLDVSPDGKYVVGTGTSGLPVIWSDFTGIQPMGTKGGFGVGVAQGGSAACGTYPAPREAFYWTPSGGVTSIGFLPGGNVSQSSDISDDGLVVVGQSTTASQPEGFIWTAGGGMTGLGSISGEGDSWALGVSGDGNVVVGHSKGANGQEAFRWTEGTMVGLGALPGFTNSAAYGASYDGSVIVGESRNGTTIYEATMWSGGSVIGLGHLPGETRSQAFDISGDGQVVVGFSLIEGGVAIIWDAVNGIRNLKQILETEYGLDLTGWRLFQALRTSSDGKVIVGNGINPQGNQEAWRAVLDSGKPITIISPVENEVVGILTDYDILWASEGVDTLRIEYSIDDGETYFLVASNVPADSNKYAWEVPSTPSDSCRLKLTDVDNSDVFAVSERFRIGDAITITSPEPGERWIAGEPDTILWQSSGVDTINILFSQNYRDGGGFFDTLAVNIPAVPGEYVWNIPDSILSAHCAILLEDAANMNVFSDPPEFKIKGYVLTRFKADSSYEAYEVDKHAWRFGNSDGIDFSVKPPDFTNAIMWPQKWWKQFDYKNGINPNTNGPYPPHWSSFPIFAEAQDFPDWPLMVQAFGFDQFYWNGPFGSFIYRPYAELKWFLINGDWGGSCTGFALSSFLAFANKTTFRAGFPEMPDFTTLATVANNDATRKIINALWIYQFGTLQREQLSRDRHKTPVQTLEEVKEMVLGDSGEIKTLTFHHQNGSGGHRVSPYKVMKDTTNSDIEWIYVYDNNFPGDATKRIKINKSVNTWDYSGLKGWGGSEGLFLRLPVSNYLTHPILPKAGAQTQPATSLDTSEGFMTIGVSPNASTQVTNSNGSTIGYADSVSFNNMTDGVAIIPETGFPHPPIGYYVPEDEYSVKMSQFTKNRTFCSIITPTVIYSYARSDADSNQTDFLSFKNGFAVRNTDARPKQINLETISVATDIESVFDIQNIQMQQDDSLHFDLEDSRLNVINIGLAKVYSLRLRLSSAAKEAFFEHDSISIITNSRHQISPDWGNLNQQPVTIYIDLGNDGTVDDSLLVENQTTNIEEKSGEVVPQSFVLYQNYPNPFNPETEIRFQLPKESQVVVKIFNTLGKEVRTLANARYTAGIHSVRWDSKDKDGNAVSSGVYIYQVKAGSFTQAKKMSLLR